MKKILFCVSAYAVYLLPTSFGVAKFILVALIAVVLLFLEYRARKELRKMDGKNAYLVLDVKELDEHNKSVVLAEDSGSRKFRNIFSVWPPEGYREVISMGKVLLIPARRV